MHCWACLVASHNNPTKYLFCSTVGGMLATRLQCPFYEGDDYHPKANKGRLSELCKLWHMLLAELLGLL